MPGAAAGINAGFAYVELRLDPKDYISAPLKEQTEGAAEEASKSFREKLTDGIKSAGKAAAKGLDTLGLAAGAALAAGLAEGMDVQAANSKLKAQLGLTQAESERIGKVAGTLFANAYGDSMEDVNEAVKSVIQNIDGMRTASSAALQETTKDALNLATVMDEDVSSVTRAVAQMLKTQMAPNAKAAFDILAAGVQNGANKSEDLLDTFNEYSVQFKKLGLDGAAALGLIQQGLQGGARDSDLVADALKEFSLIAVDITAAKEPLEALHLPAQKFVDAIAKGGPGATEALATILDRLRAVKDPAERATLATKLFGTQAEDLGAALFKLDPRTAVKGLGDFKGAIDNVDKALGDNAQATLTAFKRQLTTSVTNVIVQEVLPALQNFMAFLQGLGVSGNNIGQIAVAVGALALGFKAASLAVTGIQAAVGAYQAVAGAVGLATTAIQLQVLALQEQAVANGVSVVRQLAMNIAQTAGTAITWLQVAATWALNGAIAVLTSPITLVIAAIVALIAIFVLLYKNNETFRNVVNATWQLIQQGLQALWNFMITAWNAISGVIQAAWAFVQPIFQAIWNWAGNTLVAVFRTLWQQVQIVWQGIQLAINVAWTIIQGIWQALQIYINNVLIPVFKLIQFWFELVWFAVRTAAILGWRIVEGVWALIKIYIDTVLLPVFRLIQTVFKAVWDKVSEFAAAAWEVIKPIWDAIWQFIKNVLVINFQLLQTVAKTVWDAISNIITGVWNNFIKPVFDAIVATVGVIVTAFKDAVGLIAKHWDGIKEATKAPIKFVIETVYRDGIKAVWDKVADIVKLPHMPDPPKFARGGIMPGYAPGKDSLFAYVSPGEAIMRPEFTKAVGSDFIHHINGTARSSGPSGVTKLLAGVGDPGGVIPGFAGQFGLGGIVGDFFDSAKNFFAGGFMKIAEKTFNGIIDGATGKIGGTPFGQLAIAIPKMMIQKVLGIFKEHENEVGGSIGAVNAIRKVIGTPYSWGGGGPNGPSKGIDQGANTVGFDCSSLMQYGEYQAFKKIIPRTTGQQRPWLKQIPGPIPGAIGQPNPDHTFMATEKGTIVEAPHTGAFVREVGMRQAPFWGLPPYRANADTGSQLMPGLNPPIYNGTGQPEPILNPRQMSIVERALDQVEAQASHTDNSIKVYPQRANFTIADLEALEARRTALSRSGRPK